MTLNPWDEKTEHTIQGLLSAGGRIACAMNYVLDERDDKAIKYMQDALDIINGLTKSLRG